LESAVLLIGSFSAEARREEKHLSRARDDLRLNSGQISGSELAQQNCMVAAFDPVRARIVRRRLSVDLSACRKQGDRV
jgi:hypothetical protein